MQARSKERLPWEQKSFSKMGIVALIVMAIAAVVAWLALDDRR